MIALMRTQLRFLQLLLLTCMVVILTIETQGKVADKKPNFIVILTDDQGYNDLSCYGATDVATPQIDQMAKEGVRCTSFYVSPVCSPTRASLMTGCYPQRVGIGGVMFPRNNHGLHPDELTLPELLQEQGYKTALIGKWHLGNQDKFLPLNHGFDYWYGTPASNSQPFDATIKTFAEDCVYRDGYTVETVKDNKEAKCPLMRNDEVIEVPADQTQFTKRYTEETIQFITENKDQPFLIYLAHNMPHIPLHASESFVGTSQRGLYGDVVEELDWGIGEVLRALKDQGLDENTMVILTSDNGPKIEAGGSASPLREGKGSSYEGGVRVPCIIRWPGTIPGNRLIDAPLTIMDILPTLVTLAGGTVPTDRVIDGHDIFPVLTGAKANSPHEAIYYTKGRSVKGIRVRDWKLYTDTISEPLSKPVVELSKEEKALPRDERKALIKERSRSFKSKKVQITELYNLREDFGEQQNRIEQHPEMAQRLQEMMKAFTEELRSNQRPAGVAE